MKRPSFTPTTAAEAAALRVWIDNTSTRFERVRRSHPLLVIRAVSRMIKYELHREQSLKLKSILANISPAIAGTDGSMTNAQVVRTAAAWMRENDPPDPPEPEVHAFVARGLSFAPDTVYNRELAQAARCDVVCGSEKSRGWIWVDSAVSCLLYSRRDRPASQPTVGDLRRQARCRAIGALSAETREETLRALDAAMRLAGVDAGWMAVFPEEP